MNIPKIQDIVLNVASLATIATITTWLGHSITKVGILHGFGFGVSAGVVSSLAYPVIHYFTGNKMFSVGMSVGLGCLAAFTASSGAASLGFVAAPIPLAGAALITAIVVVGKLSAYFIVLKSLNILTSFLTPSEKKKIDEQFAKILK